MYICDEYIMIATVQVSHSMYITTQGGEVYRGKLDPGLL